MRSSTPSGRAPGARRYRASFIDRVHYLLAKGYERLLEERTAGELQTKEEPEITGILRLAMNQARHDPRIRDWAWLYYAEDDPPVEVDGLEGKCRHRIDIKVVKLRKATREPCFYFEAKRLYDQGSLTKYVGDDGLKSLLNGWYGRDHENAGMLAYVQRGSCNDWATAVSTHVGDRRAHYALPARDEYWQKRRAPPELSSSFTSLHPKAKARPLQVHHTFLLCH